MIKQWLFLIVIVAVAFVFRFQHLGSFPPSIAPQEVDSLALSLSAYNSQTCQLYYTINNAFGLFPCLESWALTFGGHSLLAIRIVSALTGLLTVIGLYVFTKRIFDWRIASAASFLMAVSFWPVALSRSTLDVVLIPLISVWGFYFLWTGLYSVKNTRDFFWAGALFAIGLYAHSALYILPLVVLLVCLTYWHLLDRAFDNARYDHTRTNLVKGLGALIISFCAIGLPMLYYLYSNIEDVASSTWGATIFNGSMSAGQITSHIASTFSDIVFSNSAIALIHIPGTPMLSWAIGTLAAIGFVRGVIKIFQVKQHHGHFSVLHSLLTLWFLIGIIPALLVADAVQASLFSVATMIPLYIFAGEALWWIYEYISRGAVAEQMHTSAIPMRYIRKATFVSSLALIVFLVAITWFEYSSYFSVWFKDASVRHLYSTQL